MVVDESREQMFGQFDGLGRVQMNLHRLAQRPIIERFLHQRHQIVEGNIQRSNHLIFGQIVDLFNVNSNEIFLRSIDQRLKTFIEIDSAEILTTANEDLPMIVERRLVQIID